MKKFFILALALAASGVFISAISTFEAFSVKNYERSIEYKEGDIIFQSSMSGQSMAIQLATGSKYSHVGMLFKEKNKWFVYEAIQPVCVTPIEQWINRGDNNHYVVKRLSNADSLLSPEVIGQMKSIAKKYIGENYDIYFEWSDENIYCSELVWKIFKQTTDLEIGKLQALKEFDFSHPIVQATAKERYGSNIPEDEMAISPGEMFNSELLELVISVNDF